MRLIGRVGLFPIAVALIVFVAVGPLPLRAQESQSKAEDKQQQEEKKTRKIWTNDDFPQRPLKPKKEAERKPAGKKAKSKKAPPQPPEAIGTHLTPQEWETWVKQLENDTIHTQNYIAELREKLRTERDFEERQRLQAELERMEVALMESQDVLEALRNYKLLAAPESQPESPPLVPSPSR